MSLAERALAAAEAKEREQEAEKQAQIEARRNAAVSAILIAAETEFGLDLSSSEVHRVGGIDNRPSIYSNYQAVIYLTDDANLFLTWDRSSQTPEAPGTVKAEVRLVDELAYDLKPGEKPILTGRNRHHRSSRADIPVRDLAEVGQAIEKTEEARVIWHRRRKAEADAAATAQG